MDEEKGLSADLTEEDRALIRDTAEGVAGYHRLDVERVHAVYQRLAFIRLEPPFPPAFRPVGSNTRRVWFSPAFQRALLRLGPPAALDLFERTYPLVLNRRSVLLGHFGHPMVPFLTLDELADAIDAYIRHRRMNRDCLVRTGWPGISFARSPWLDWHHSSLYPTRIPARVFDLNTVVRRPWLRRVTIGADLPSACATKTIRRRKQRGTNRAEKGMIMDAELPLRGTCPVRWPEAMIVLFSSRQPQVWLHSAPKPGCLHRSRAPHSSRAQKACGLDLTGPKRHAALGLELNNLRPVAALKADTGTSHPMQVGELPGHTSRAKCPYTPTSRSLIVAQRPATSRRRAGGPVPGSPWRTGHGEHVDAHDDRGTGCP